MPAALLYHPAAPATSRRVGVDSDSCHRLLGEVRRSETPALHVFPRGSLGVVAEALPLELDVASAASDYVHGVVLPVDGGWLAR